MKMKLKSKISILLAVVFVCSLFQGMPAKASGHPYLISINKQMNTVTIYGKDDNGEYTVPVKAFVCSTGYATPLGDFTIQEQYRWKELMGGAWGQYSSRVTWDGIIIHSVWYYGPYVNRQNSVRFNDLGNTNSNGCINLCVRDCKWIYDHCSVGCPIHIYNSSNPGPLGKPEMLKVPYSMGYDPTDIWSADNPYNDKKPVISGVKNHKVNYGEAYSVMDGVTAKNTTGYDATKLVETVIKFDGKTVKKVDTKKPGIYEVTYKITDQIGRKDKKSAVITVVDNVKPELRHVKDRKVDYGTKVNKELVRQYVTAKWHKEDLTGKIKVTIEKKKDSYYKVIYTVTAPNGKSAKAVCHYTVRPDRTLSFEGIEDKVLSPGSIVDKKTALEGVKAFRGEDRISDGGVKVTIKQMEPEEAYDVYEVTYYIKNSKTDLTSKAYIRVQKAQEPGTGADSGTGESTGGGADSSTGESTGGGADSGTGESTSGGTGNGTGESTGSSAGTDAGEGTSPA